MSFRQKNINAIIIDDEIRCIELLEMDLKKYCPEVSIIGGYSSPEEGLKAIENQRPELVFLDIEMPWMNGFELLEQVGDLFFEVIFTTAYDQFALKAFQVSAVDYLLKPVDPDALKTAVTKALDKLGSGTFTAKHIETLLRNYNQPTPNTALLALPTFDGFEFVKFDDIIYLSAEGSYTSVILTEQRKHLISKRLKSLEEILPTPPFCRIHQSYLINVHHVAHYIRGEGGEVKMDNGNCLTVARSKKKEFIAMINVP